MGKAVYAVADGQIFTGGGWGGKSYGQLLINHTDPNGMQWSSGYLHMKNVAKTSGAVKKGDVIGYVSNVSHSPSLPHHLHFAVYAGHNGVTSKPVTLSCQPQLSMP